MSIHLTPEEDNPSWRERRASMFGPREGSWWLKSQSDPRFNLNGRGYVGGLVVPPDAQKALDELAERLGESPPKDLEFGYMKD